VKLNQCQGVYVESCDFSGGWNCALDCVGCQYGHVLSSRLHRASYCVYMKGGSAYFVLAGNEVYDCNEGGIDAGDVRCAALRGAGSKRLGRPIAAAVPLTAARTACRALALSSWSRRGCATSRTTSKS
jgi:hypothetical protein